MKLHRSNTLLPVLALAPLQVQEFSPAPMATAPLLNAFPSEIADNGEVSGFGFTSSSGDVPVVVGGGPPQLLGLLPSATSGLALGLNNNQQVVGSSTVITPSGDLIFLQDSAVLWDASTTPTELATLLPGGSTLELFNANDINDAGQIVGWGRDAAIPQGIGWLLDNGVITSLGGLGGLQTQALAINEPGQIVGLSEVVSGGWEHAVTWDNGVLQDLHDPTVILGAESTALDINDFGVIVGEARFESSPFTGPEVGAIWYPDGTIVEIPTLGGTLAAATGINNDAWIVGFSTTSTPGDLRGFLMRDGVVKDLNDLIDPASGWLIQRADQVNASGVIVGVGVLGGAQRGVILTPDPCTGFFDVYGVGCAGTGGVTPALAGFGCPAGDATIQLDIQGGQAGALGGLVFGTGQGTLAVSPFCDLQVLPLAAPIVPLVLDGEGSACLTFVVPAALSGGDVFAQAGFLDLGAAGSFSSAPPVQIHVQ